MTARCGDEAAWTGILTVELVLAEEFFLCALLDGDRPLLGLAKRDFHPSGDFLCLRLLPRLLRASPLGSSMTVWYFGGSEAGPPPTSMYCVSFWLLASCSALLRASSNDKSFVGVEMASDLGRVLFKAPPPLGMSSLSWTMVGTLSLKIRSTYRTRHSVTTAWTPTPCHTRIKKKHQSFHSFAIRWPAWKKKGNATEYLKGGHATKFQLFATEQIVSPDDGYILGRHACRGIVFGHSGQVPRQVLERSEMRRWELLDNLEKEKTSIVSTEIDALLATGLSTSLMRTTRRLSGPWTALTNWS